MTGSRDVALTAAALALLVVPVLAFTDTGTARPTLLSQAFLHKTVAATALACLLIGLAAVLPKGGPARAPAPIAGLAIAVSVLYAAAALTTPHADVVAVALPILLPLCAVVCARDPGIGATAILYTLAGVAVVLAAGTWLELAGVSLANEVQARPAVTLVHRNNLAFHLVAGAPLVVALALREPRRLARLGWLVAAALVISAAVAARSRTGWIALPVAMIPLVATLGRRSAVAVGATLICGLAVVALAPRGGVESIGARARAAFDPDREAAWFERATIYRDVVGHIAERPGLGHGAGTYAKEHTTLIASGGADHAHNDVLDAAYSAGVAAGLALAVLLVGVPLNLARRARRRRDLVAAGVAGSLVAWLVLGLTNSPLALAPSAAHFWLTLGLALRPPTEEIAP